MIGWRMRACGPFEPESLGSRACEAGLLLDQAGFRVRAAVLDHGTPCLAFAIEEKSHVNVWKNRVTELGLPTGSCMKRLKDAVVQGLPDDTPIRAHWHERVGPHERVFALGSQRGGVVRIVAGEGLPDVTDAAFTEIGAATVAPFHFSPRDEGRGVGNARKS